MIRSLACALFALGLAGCASMQPVEFQHLQQNRYAELRDVMEQKVPALAQGKTADLVYLCFAYSKIRQYDRLFPCIEQMERNLRAGDRMLFWWDFSSTPALLRAVAAMEFGDYAQAVEAADLAVRLTDPPQSYRQLRIYALSAAGLARGLAGQREAASAFADKLAAVPADGLEVSDKYLGLARIHMALGEYARAYDYLRRDDEENAFLKGMTNLVSGSALAGESLFTYWEMPVRFMKSRALLEMGRRDEAKAGYEGLLREAGVAQSADLYWLVLYDRGRIAEAENDLAAAAALYRRAIDEIEQQRASIRAEAAKIGFVGDKQAVYLNLVGVLVTQGQVEAAFDVAERAKARALVDLLATRQQFSAAKVPAAARGLLDELSRADAGAVVQDVAATAARRQLRAAQGELRGRLQAAAPELASLVTVSTLALAEIQARLAADETLVEYFGGDDRLFAFVVGHSAVHVFRLDGKGLGAEVEQLRRQFVDTPGEGDPLPALQALHRRLVKPLRPALAGERLLLVGHGPLHYLPFAALHDGNAYLLQRYALRQLPSASVIGYLKAGAGRAGMLLLGNPDVNDRGMDLAFAQTEVETIARSVPGATVLLRKAATETAIKRDGRRFGRLHFASHGIFRAEAPLRSGLLLAADGDNDGLLSVDELYALDLDADLVVLSACETALGRIESGDDVIGFTRGFLFAGARAIVSSLWSVDDQATSDLMVAFHATAGREDRAQALRRAQLAMLEKYRHPFYWAAFQLTGEAR